MSGERPVSTRGREGAMTIHAELELLMTLKVELWAPVITIGQTDRGFLRLIPITGGTLSGARLIGTAVPGGFDWNTAMDE